MFIDIELFRFMVKIFEEWYDFIRRLGCIYNYMVVSVWFMFNVYEDLKCFNELDVVNGFVMGIFEVCYWVVVIF